MKWLFLIVFIGSVSPSISKAKAQKNCVIEINEKEVRVDECFKIQKKSVPIEFFRFQLEQALKWPSLTEARIKRSEIFYRKNNPQYRAKLVEDQKFKISKKIDLIESFILNSGFSAADRNELQKKLRAFKKSYKKTEMPKDFDVNVISSLFFKNKKIAINQKKLKNNKILKSIFLTKVYSDEKINFEFVEIPTGSATLGSPDSDLNRFSDEELRTVKVSSAFYLQKSLVTQKEWLEVVGSNPSRFNYAEYCPSDYQNVDGIGLCPLNPVENVSADDIKVFLEIASYQQAQYKFELPDSDQWEYAVRGMAKSIYWFGDKPDETINYCWVESISNSQTHPVATKGLNSFGLADTCGNVWQLVASQDGFKLRGGSWTGGPRISRHATHLGISSSDHFSNAGFRLLRSPIK